MASRSTLNLLFSKLNKHSSFSLSSHSRLHSNLIIFVTLLCTSSSLSTPFFVWQEPKLHTVFLVQSGRHWECISAGDALVDTSAAAAQCLLILRLLSTRAPSSFSTELVSNPWVDPIICCTSGLCFPKCKTVHLFWFNLIRFLLAHSYNLSQSSCSLALPSEMPTSLLSLVLANFVSVHLSPSSK